MNGSIWLGNGGALQAIAGRDVYRDEGSSEARERLGRFADLLRGWKKREDLVAVGCLPDLDLVPRNPR